MPIATTLDEAPRRRRDEHGVFESWLMNGDVAESLTTPTCKLVEQDPNSVIHPHFHHVDQFQVIVAGTGSLGKKSVRPLTLHYAGAYTPYGPIVTAEGLAYFVVRDGVDRGAGFMPQARAQLPSVPRRHRVVEWVPPVSAADLAAGVEPASLPVIPLEDDGLATWLYRLRGGQAWVGPDPSAGGGQFHLIVSGGVQYQGRDFFRLACLYTGPDEAPQALVAGTNGAEILTMQFPRHSVAA